MLITNTSFVIDNSTVPPTIIPSNPVTTVTRDRPIIVDGNNFWDPFRHWRPCFANHPIPLIID